jgi:hypothetical protein
MSDEQSHHHHELQARVSNALGHFTYARSLFSVGASLLSQYPTEEAWEGACEDPQFLAALEGFFLTIMDMEQAAEADERYIDPDNLLELTAQHFDRAVDAVGDLSMQMEVGPQDLAFFLLNA